MDFFSIMAEDKIRRAMEDGEFNNLPGFGKPLQLDDISHIPEDLRMAYRLLKNANMLEDVNRLKEELLTIDHLIEACDSPEEKQKLARKKHQKQLKFESLMKKRNTLNAPPSSFYKQKMLDRLKVTKE